MKIVKRLEVQIREVQKEIESWPDWMTDASEFDEPDAKKSGPEKDEKKTIGTASSLHA